MEPFIWAFLIAFFLNGLLNILEKHFQWKNWANILIVYCIFYGIIILLFTIVVPKVIENIKSLSKEIPYYINRAENWLLDAEGSFDRISRYGILDFIVTNLDQFFSKLGRNVGLIINKSITYIISLTSNFINFILGSVISIYILKDKEYFVRNIKRLIYAIFSVKRGNIIIDIFKQIKGTFSNFLVGKLLDSFIIGILCFIGCLLMGIKYSILISLIVGVTNMVPYFGPFIGMIPAAIVTVFYSPFKALLVTLFIFLLQQFDGLYLGPKILGIQVGLKPFWIILSILIGGGFFGVWGMLFAVPTFAVIKNLLGNYIDKQLK